MVNLCAARYKHLQPVNPTQGCNEFVSCSTTSSSLDPPKCPPLPIVSAPLPVPMFVCCHHVSTAGLLAKWRAVVPCVRLVAVSDYAKKQAAEEAIEPYVLPPLILILLPWLHAKQPAAGGIVMVFMCMVSGTSHGGRCELSLLGASGDVGDDLKAGSWGGDEARGAEGGHVGGIWWPLSILGGA